MPKDGEITKEKILQIAETMVLSHGFAATSIDKVIEEAGVTKGAFFYHFKSKAELALALVERYAAWDNNLLLDYLARAEKLSRDPAQQILIFVGLFQEMLSGLTEPPAGCLIASYCYQNQLFNDEVMGVCSNTFIVWRKNIADKFKQAFKQHKPVITIDPESLADNLLTTLEGAFVMAKTLKDPKIMNEQLTHYKNYLELLFGHYSA